MTGRHFLLTGLCSVGCRDKAFENAAGLNMRSQNCEFANGLLPALGTVKARLTDQPARRRRVIFRKHDHEDRLRTEG